MPGEHEPMLTLFRSKKQERLIPERHQLTSLQPAGNPFEACFRSMGDPVFRFIVDATDASWGLQ